jgi:protein-disulfide isomerase
MKIRTLFLVLASVAAACTAVKDDKSTKDLEARLAKLEGEVASHKEMIDWLKPIKAQQEGQRRQQEEQEPDPNARFAIDVSGSPANGKPALVTIVEGFDFACPYCLQVSPTLDELVKEYDGKVQVVYKNFVVHPDVAMGAHLASCAAHKQGKYVEFKDKFWEDGFGKYMQTQGQDRSGFADDAIFKMAGDLKLDVAKFKADMKGDECKKMIDADMAELNKFGVRGTPAIWVNGKTLPGAVPKPQLKAIIDEELKIAEGTGIPAAEYYQKEVMAKGEKKFKSRGGQN